MSDKITFTVRPSNEKSGKFDITAMNGAGPVNRDVVDLKSESL